MKLTAIIAISIIGLYSNAFAMQGMGPGPGVKGYSGAPTPTPTATPTPAPTPTPTPTPTPFTASDDFNREDSNTLGVLSDGVHTWTEYGDIDIETNRAGLGTAGTAIATIGVDLAAGWFQSGLNAEGSAYSQPGKVFWLVDTSNYWYACLDPDDGAGNDIELHQVVADVDTEVADAAFTAGVNTTYTMLITFGPTSVVVNIDSTDYITHNGSFSEESGDIGIMQSRGGAATGWTDDFSAGE